MTLNCVIIDDEPLAADLLASYAQKTSFLNVIGTYNSAITAIKDIREKNVDLVFLDIQMPELSGLEFAQIIKDDAKIIFTTAFNQYAIDGYKVDALDYLLKPIAYEDFLKSVTKALKWFSYKKKMDIYTTDRFIFVKSDYKLVQISFDNLLYVEGLKDYVRFYFDNDQKTIVSLMNMKNVEEHLPRPEFMRTHRSYIVNMTKIKMVERGRIVFGDTYIPISDSYKLNVEQYLDDHTLS